MKSQASFRGKTRKEALFCRHAGFTMRVIEKAPRLLRAAELPDRNISADKNDFLVGNTVGSENDNFQRSGAGDGLRTRDPQLGRLML